MRDARAVGYDMDTVGQRYLTVAYEMLFVHGFFHGDLHPGNVIVMEGERLGLLDFGMVGRLTDEMRSNVISIVFALQRGDFRTIARLFYEIAIKERRVDYRAVERDTIEVMEKHWGGGSIRDMQMGSFVMDLARRAARHGARVPQAYTMFFKAIVTSEGLAKTLVEEVDPIAAAQPYFSRMVQERFSRERMEQDGFYSALTATSLATRIPVSLVQFLDDVDDQRLVLNLRNRADEDAIRARDRATNRAILAAFGVALLACGAILWPYGRFHGVPVLAPLLWLADIPVVVLLLLAMFRNRGPRRRDEE
jgi:ubiquinone biosynthesis protein